MNSNKKPFNDIASFIYLVQQTLNENNRNRYRIEKFNNNQDYNYENLISDKEIQGVLIASNIQASMEDEGTESKDIIIKFLVPMEKINSVVENDLIILIKSLNDTNVEYEDDIHMNISEFTIADYHKINQLISGNEYFEVTLSAHLQSTMAFVQFSDEKIFVDDVRLKGVLGIDFESNKTMDGSISLSGKSLQKNTINGIQVAIAVDIQFYKNDELHKKLIDEACENKTYSVKYFDGYSEKSYEMCTSVSKRNIRGSNLVGKITFSLAQTNG